MVKRQGIVLEVHDRWATILNEKGQYKKIKTARPMQVGELWSESSPPLWKLATAAVIILAFLAACVDFFSVVAYAQVSSGVKIGVNRWDRVVTVDASNARTAEYIQKANLRGRKIDEVVEQVVTDTLSLGLNHSAPDRPVLTVTTTRKDEINRQRLVQKLNKKVQPLVMKKKIHPVEGSDGKGKGKSNLPAVQSRGENHSSLEVKDRKVQVKPVDIPERLKKPSTRQDQGKGNKAEVQPLQSKDKPGMQAEDIKTKPNNNADIPAWGQKDKESLPAAVNRQNDKVEHPQKVPVGQSEKPYTPPKVNNKQTPVPGQGDQLSDKKSNR